MQYKNFPSIFLNHQMLDYASISKFYENNKYVQDDFNQLSFRIESLFKETDWKLFLNKSCEYLPLLMFLKNSSKSSFSTFTSNSNSIIINTKSIGNLFELTIDINYIARHLKENNSVDFQLDRNYFITNIIVNLYRYSCFRILNSIKTIGTFNFSKAFDKYNDLVHIDKPNNTQIAYLKYFEEFFFSTEFTKQDLLEATALYCNLANFSKILFSSIYFAFRFSKNVSDITRNDILRPIYREIVCKVCYPKLMSLDVNDRKFKKHFSNFLLVFLSEINSQE